MPTSPSVVIVKVVEVVVKLVALSKIAAPLAGSKVARVSIDES